MLNLFKHMLISLYIHLTLLYVDFFFVIRRCIVLMFMCLSVVLVGTFGNCLTKKMYVVFIFYSLQFLSTFANLVFCFTFLFLLFCVFPNWYYFISIFLFVCSTLFQKLNLCSSIKVWVFCLFVCCFSYVCSLFSIEVEIIHKLM